MHFGSLRYLPGIVLLCLVWTALVTVLVVRWRSKGTRTLAAILGFAMIGYSYASYANLSGAPLNLTTSCESQTADGAPKPFLATEAVATVASGVRSIATQPRSVTQAQADVQGTLGMMTVYADAAAAALRGDQQPAAVTAYEGKVTQAQDVAWSACQCPAAGATTVRAPVPVAVNAALVTAAPGASAAAGAAARYFPASQVPMAVAVAGAESGYRPGATNHNTNGSTDFGEWQINSVHADLLGGRNWADLNENAWMAYQVWRQAGGSWSPWSTFNSGAYKRFYHPGANPALPAPVVVPASCAPTASTVALTVPASGTAAAAIRYAQAQLGKPYQWGATGPGTFDCSGLLVAAYNAAGHPLGVRTADQMFHRFPAEPLGALIPGDFVFSEITGGVAGHVGMYIGGGRVIEAPHTGDVVKLVGLGGWQTAARV
jgi:cell wall-associated NlpC family hydrolase